MRKEYSTGTPMNLADYMKLHYNKDKAKDQAGLYKYVYKHFDDGTVRVVRVTGSDTEINTERKENKLTLAHLMRERKPYFY